MKLTALFIFLISISSFVIADDSSNNFNNTYEHASLPNLLPYVGKGMPGRCYFVGTDKKIASVLMVSFEEDGFDVAPFDGNGKKDDFFDKMTYEEILKEFPIIKKMFLEVIETADGALVENDNDSAKYRGELRESEKLMILRVYINGKIVKYCNYNKN